MTNKERIEKVLRNHATSFPGPVADALMEIVREAQEQAWDDSAEATADWMSNNPSPSGVPHDPPRNPYEET